jgi:hypothetical protein
MMTEARVATVLRNLSNVKPLNLCAAQVEALLQGPRHIRYLGRWRPISRQDNIGGSGQSLLDTDRVRRGPISRGLADDPFRSEVKEPM